MNKFLLRYLPLFNAPDDAGAGGGAPPAAPPAAPPVVPPAAPAWHYPSLPDETKQFLASAEYGKNETPEAALIHLSQLAKAQQNADGYLPKPKDASDTAALDSIYKALGRPEAADKYDLKFPDGYTPNDKLVGFARDMAFKMGADPSKAQALVDGYLAVEKDLLSGVSKGINESNAAAMAALETEYGADLAKAKADGARALEAMGLPAETLAFFDSNKASAHVSRVLAAIGKGMTEGAGGFAPTTPNGAGLEQAKSELVAFQNSERYKEVVKIGQRHAEYKAVMAELDALGARAYPTRRA